MKPLSKFSAVLAFVFLSLTAFAQLDTRDISQYRYRDFRGINQFEALDRTIPFDGFKVRLGGAFAVQMQALSHENSGVDTLALIGNNFNLPTANLDVDVALADGMRMVPSVLRLVNASIFAVALMDLISFSRLLSKPHLSDHLFLMHQVEHLWQSFDDTWLLGLIFFGLHLIILGYLIMAFCPYLYPLILPVLQAFTLSDRCLIISATS